MGHIAFPQKAFKASIRISLIQFEGGPVWLMWSLITRRVSYCLHLNTDYHMGETASSIMAWLSPVSCLRGVTVDSPLRDHMTEKSYCDEAQHKSLSLSFSYTHPLSICFFQSSLPVMSLTLPLLSVCPSLPCCQFVLCVAPFFFISLAGTVVISPHSETEGDFSFSSSCLICLWERSRFQIEPQLIMSPCTQSEKITKKGEKESWERYNLSLPPSLSCQPSQGPNLHHTSKLGLVSPTKWTLGPGRREQLQLEAFMSFSHICWLLYGGCCWVVTSTCERTFGWLLHWRMHGEGLFHGPVCLA